MRRRRLLGILVAAAIGVLPAVAHADTSITSSNSTDGTNTESGDATSHNSGTAQVGHSGGGSVQDGTSSAETDDATGADIDNTQATNVQEGDNELDVSQDATAVSGDTVGGQVIGAVNAEGLLSIDATNLSRDVDLESGDATADDDFAAFVGLAAGSATALGADDISNLSAHNVQVGDNSSSVLQDTDAASGDAVGGQVVGGRSGGPSDIVVANTSEDTDADSGDADESSDVGQFTGLQAVGVLKIA